MTRICRNICALSGLLVGLVLSVSAGAGADTSASAAPGADVSSETWVLQSGTQLVGDVGTVIASHEDTLTDIARKHGLGYEEIIWANPGTDIWLPGEGTVVTLPTRFILPSARSGLVVNIAEYRVYYFHQVDGKPGVSTFPVSIGRMDWSTPIGRWSVVAKQKDPAWYPPESIRNEHLTDGRGVLEKVVPAGPDNPLGQYAMRLSLSGYLIHGTNRPVGIGMQVTHGCIRMYPEDIEWLFPQVPVGAPVTIVNQPYKFGWAGDDLYLEAHPPLEDDKLTREREMTVLTEEYVQATRDRPAQVNWRLVEDVYRRHEGVPVRVGTAINR